MKAFGVMDGVGPALEVVADDRALAERGAELVDSWCTVDARARGTCRVALAGGTTPIALYRAWAARHRVDPARLELWYGDERCVPPDHVDSNHRAALEALIEPLGVPPERVHAVDGAALDREDAARRYAATLPERFDLVLLGLGPDGHTMSLFPGDAAALAEEERGALFVVGPKPPPERITLTPVVLERARRVLVLASGSSKAPAVARALDPATRPVDCPVALARGRAWLLDEAAARALGPQHRTER